MLHVAVGVIKNKHGEVLISRRASGVHQGDLWEFPGGKVEAGESTYQALKRELLEELGIEIGSCEPLLDIYHDYGDVEVHLDVNQVSHFQGTPQGLEGQPVKWVSISNLKKYAFPAANKNIINCLNLVDCYPIIDDSLGNAEQMLEHLNWLLARGYSMIQLRAKSLGRESFERLAKEAIALCAKNDATLYINTSIEIALSLNASAVHLSSQALRSATLPLPVELRVATSCHNEIELMYAQQAGVLFAVLSPVLHTQSHPEKEPLGWDLFSSMAEKIKLPVYALGGVGPADVGLAKSKGARGVSGIRAFNVGANKA